MGGGSAAPLNPFTPQCRVAGFSAGRREQQHEDFSPQFRPDNVQLLSGEEEEGGWTR